MKDVVSLDSLVSFEHFRKLHLPSFTRQGYSIYSFSHLTISVLAATPKLLWQAYKMNKLLSFYSIGLASSRVELIKHLSFLRTKLR